MAWTTPATVTTGDLVTAAWINQYVRDNMSAVLPVGTLILRAADYTTVETAVESRWLQCNGVAVSRTTYSVLFNYLNGLTPALPFGSGDGSTTFNLPDLRGRAAVAEGSHSDVDDMGDSDGLSVGSRTPKTTFTTTPLAGGATTALNSPTSTNPGFLVVGSWFIKYTS